MRGARSHIDMRWFIAQRPRWRLRTLVCALLLGALLAAFCAPGAQATGSVYTVGGTSNYIWQYTIYPDGALGAKSPAYLPTNSGPQFLAITPDGKDLFVTDRDVDAVSPFDVGATGALSSQSPDTVGVVRFPWGIAISPDGKSAYVAGSFSNVVGQYSIGAGGVLTAKSPETVPAGVDPVTVAVSPDGHSVYVVNDIDSVSIGSVSQYTVAADGRLTAKTPASVPTGTGPMGMALTPDGTSAYVVNTDGTISQYEVGPGGLLSPKVPAYLDTGAHGIRYITVSPDGKSAYVPDPANQRVWQLDIGASGALSSKNPAYVFTPSGTAPYMLAMTPDGKYAYATDYGVSHVHQFDVTFGGLLALKTQVLSGGRAFGIAVSPAQGPTAAFSANAAPLGSSSSFDASASSDPDGRVARYDWDWGDGMRWSDANPQATHTYATVGTYTVTLTVTDDLGCSTNFVFTGQTAYCNGGPAASVTHTIDVGPVVAKAPDSITPPAISGSAIEGRTLTEVSGGWTESPFAFGQQWFDCDSRGAGCVAITGANARTLVLKARDVGHTMRVRESATNAGGTRVSALSAPTGMVLSATPKLTGVSLTPAKLRLPRRGPATGRLHFTLSIAAGVTVTVQQALDGRQVRGRCEAPSQKNRRARRCTRYPTLPGMISYAGRAGANHAAFIAKLGNRVVPSGKYRLVAVASANGRRSAVRSFAFTIAR